MYGHQLTPVEGCEWVDDCTHKKTCLKGIISHEKVDTQCPRIQTPCLPAVANNSSWKKSARKHPHDATATKTPLLFLRRLCKARSMPNGSNLYPQPTQSPVHI